MRYIGSKANIINFLDESISSIVADGQNKTFADLLSGTTVVAKHFKQKGFKIITNDYMSFSYVLQKAYICTNSVPSFSKLRSLGLKTYEEILDHLNRLEPKEGFFYENYCEDGTRNKNYIRNYFSSGNAKKIDAILEEISLWKGSGLISDNEASVLKASLIDAVTRVSNISGTYGAFLKKDDPRKDKALILEPIIFIPSKEEHICYNEDIFELLDKVSGDILYLDPPYNQRQYPPYYHILETLCLNDNPSIYGKTGRRPYKNMISPFCIKSEVKGAFNQVLRQAKFRHIFISYNTEGLLSLEELQEVAGRFGKIKCFTTNHRRYKSNGNSLKNNALKEVLIYVKKKR